MRYLIVDLTNSYFRARHAAHRGTSTEEKVAFAIHVTLSSINKAWRDQKGDHVVICLEGRSWRKDYYKPYKANRAEARAALNVKEAEEDRMFWQGLDDLKVFLQEKSNCTVLQHPELEADDLIAGWIQYHTKDHHTIISSDSDFHQLLAENVNQYNGVADELHTINGIYDGKGKPVIDKKTKEPKKIPDPAWILFEKIVRGDPTDNVFSAFPGARVKSSRSKVGLTEAFADRDKQGYAWNNFMLQRWTDHLDVEHKVLDDYNRNKVLIDLSAQPDHIRAKINETIKNSSVPKTQQQIGIHFLRFCGKYDLKRLGDSADKFAQWLQSSYQEKEMKAA